MVVITIGIVFIEDLLPNHSLHFPFRHLSVKGIGDDDVNVVYTVAGEHVQDDLEDALPNVWRSHRRQRQTDVVNSHCDAHARFELGEQRITTEWMIQRITNGSLAVRQSLDWRIGIEHPRANRKILEDEV